MFCVVLNLGKTLLYYCPPPSDKPLRQYANSRPLPCCVAFCSQPVPRVCWREFEAVGKRRGGERSGRIRFESRPPRPQSDVNSREDALKAYRAPAETPRLGAK